MICTPCAAAGRRAALLAAIAEAMLRDSPRAVAAYQQRIDEGHAACDAPASCTCQHRGTPAQRTPGK